MKKYFITKTHQLVLVGWGGVFLLVAVVVKVVVGLMMVAGG